VGKLISAFEKASTSAAYPYGTMNFIPALGIHFRIVKNRTRWRVTLKGFHGWGKDRFL
jgi:hypothetical protein